MVASLCFCALGALATFIDVQLNSDVALPRPPSIWRMYALGLGFLGILCLLNGFAHAVATLITRFVVGKKQL